MKRRRLTQLRQEIRDCRRCDLLSDQRVLPSGGVESTVMVIGQAPGKRELVTSKPFSGPAGARLFEWLARIGIGEEDFRHIAYITAIAKCYPGHQPGRKTDKPPTSLQAKNCFPFLEREIKILRPKLLIPIGRLALKEVLGSYKLVDVVGRKFKKEIFGHGCTIVPLPHPSGANPWNFRNSKYLDKALELLQEELQNG